MKKYTTYSLLFLFLSFCIAAKPSSSSSADKNPIVNGLVAAAGLAMFADLITGQKGSGVRTVAGCAYIALSANDNKLTPVSALVAAGIIGNHVNNLRNGHYYLFSKPK